MNKLIKKTLLLMMASTLSFTVMANDAALGVTPTNCEGGANISKEAAAAMVKSGDNTVPGQEVKENATKGDATPPADG